MWLFKKRLPFRFFFFRERQLQRWAPQAHRQLVYLLKMPRAKFYGKYGPYNELAEEYEKMTNDCDYYRNEKRDADRKLEQRESQIQELG